MKGFIKLHRSILSWEWYKDLNTKSIFIHLLLNACYDNCRFMGQSVKRGEYITSYRRLSSELNIPIRQVRTAIKKLKETGEIDTQATNKYTKITICKYESYQLEETNKPKKATHKRHTSDTQATQINKKVIKKEDKNKTFLTECLSDSSWIEVVCMQKKISKRSLESLLKSFDAHLTITDDVKMNIRDFKSHFVNWSRYNQSPKLDDGDYTWKWKGQVAKSGSYDELTRDKQYFDKPGFGFQIIKNGN